MQGGSTRQLRVPNDVFAQVREHFAERAIVELTATIAAYNCVSRFLEALRVDPEERVLAVFSAMRTLRVQLNPPRRDILDRSRTQHLRGQKKNKKFRGLM